MSGAAPQEASRCCGVGEAAKSVPEPPGPAGLSPLLGALGEEMETGEESLAGAVQGARQEVRGLWHWLADAPPLQAFTRDAPQLGEEVSLLPLGNAVLGDTEISLESRAEQSRGDKGQG